jgi:hypothetical protein
MTHKYEQKQNELCHLCAIPDQRWSFEKTDLPETLTET